MQKGDREETLKPTSCMDSTDIVFLVSCQIVTVAPYSLDRRMEATGGGAIELIVCL